MIDGALAVAAGIVLAVAFLFVVPLAVGLVWQGLLVMLLPPNGPPPARIVPGSWQDKQRRRHERLAWLVGLAAMFGPGLVYAVLSAAGLVG